MRKLLPLMAAVGLVIAVAGWTQESKPPKKAEDSKKNAQPGKAPKGQYKSTQLPPPPPGDDNSPIIIADGSVKLDRRAFDIHGAKKAAVESANHAPTYLGYKCSPGDGTCTAGACSATPVQYCQVKLDKDWTLALSDGSSVATLSWKATKPARIDIDLPNDYSIRGNAGNGVSLVPSANQLQSATLSINSKTYPFSCTASATCVVVGYYCPADCGVN